MDQISMFDLMYPTFKTDNPVRLIELFAGVGSQAMALRNLGVPYSDAWRRECYNNIKATHNLVNICSMRGGDLAITNTDRYTYLMTYSFP